MQNPLRLHYTRAVAVHEFLGHLWQTMDKCKHTVNIRVTYTITMVHKDYYNSDNLRLL